MNFIRPQATLATPAVGLVESRHLEALLADGRPDLAGCASLLGWPETALAAEMGDSPVERLHFGSEFCETLLPAPRELRQVVRLAGRSGLGLTLSTPVLSDHGLVRLRDLLPLLPGGSEVVANDWGTLSLLQRHHPDLVPVAGRLICKMIKDPRLPSAEWGRLYPHGVHAGPFVAALRRLGVRRIEIDLPVFAVPADLRSPSLAVAVHVPYSFSVKGRSCKIGSLHQADADKFATGHRCQKECLTYVSDLARPEAATTDLPSLQRGNTIFFRHSDSMTEVVRQAAAEGAVDRLIFAGDWT